MQHILQINLYNFFAIVQKNCAGGTLKKKNISNPNFSYRVHHFVQICRFADWMFQKSIFEAIFKSYCTTLVVISLLKHRCTNWWWLMLTPKISIISQNFGFGELRDEGFIEIPQFPASDNRPNASASSWSSCVGLIVSPIKKLYLSHNLSNFLIFYWIPVFLFSDRKQYKWSEYNIIQYLPYIDAPSLVPFYSTHFNRFHNKKNFTVKAV